MTAHSTAWSAPVNGATAGAGGEADPAWSQAEAAVRQSLAAAARPWPRCPPGGQPGPEAARPEPTAHQEALVEERWQALGNELPEVITRSGAAGTSQLAGAGFEQLMDTALRAGRLGSATVRALDGLAHLRNLARASAGLTQQQAQEFGVLADAVSYTLWRGGPAGARPARRLARVLTTRPTAFVITQHRVHSDGPEPA
jgi:hypothetical protein